MNPDTASPPPLRAYTVWLRGWDNHFGRAVTLARSAGKARYVLALAAHSAGVLKRANPSQVLCRRCREEDYNPALREGMIVDTRNMSQLMEDYLAQESRNESLPPTPPQP